MKLLRARLIAEHLLKLAERKGVTEASKRWDFFVAEAEKLGWPIDSETAKEAGKHFMELSKGKELTF